MDKIEVIKLAEKILQVGDGHDKETFMTALQTAVAGSIYHSYNPAARWTGLNDFCAKLSPALQAIIDGYARKSKLS